MSLTASSYLSAKFHAVRARRAAELPHDGRLTRLEHRALECPPAPLFARALRSGDTVALIAEFKRRSPSSGDFIFAGSPASTTRTYVEHGAHAVSVLTDPDDFGGSLHDLAAVTAAVTAPVLRKDFVVDRAALYETRINGAGAVLLIAAPLTPGELGELLSTGAAVGLECLVEVHDERELDSALEAGASLIGVNNRDLHSLATDLTNTERLAPRAAAHATVVSESGIHTAEDVARMRDAGAVAVLVGESLLRQPAVKRAALVRALSGVPR